jgi:FkbM family methyltransferase
MNSNLKELIFDIGMYDGSDTRYYLNEGFRVLAIDANPVLVQRARELLFQDEIKSSRLKILNFAIVEEPAENVTLVINATDPGSSKIYHKDNPNSYQYGTFSVKGITINELFDEYGIPYYLKVDIEGADELCVLGLNKIKKPQFLSFEVYDYNIISLLNYIESIGYTKFKLINQINFREISNQNKAYDLISDKIIRKLGYKYPKYVRRNGRFFLIGHSSGPAPWNSDCKWQSAKELLIKWKKEFGSHNFKGWYELQAM